MYIQFKMCTGTQFDSGTGTLMYYTVFIQFELNPVVPKKKLKIRILNSFGMFHREFFKDKADKAGQNTGFSHRRKYEIGLGRKRVLFLIHH
jgi:hypothetical protein